MLRYLRVANLALMEAAALEFEGGLVSVTGETGAGKSVLIGALQLLSGDRAEKTMIRQGAESCSLEAALHFPEPTAINAALEAIGLPLCEDGVLLLKRTFSRSKMPQIQVNGGLSTLAQLQELGEYWIDFHGPGEPQKLYKEKWQLSLLDRYAKAENVLAPYGQKYREWRELLKQIAELREQEQLDPDEQEYLQRQIDAIDKAALTEDGVEELERDFTRLSKAQELTGFARQIENALAGDGGTTETLGPALHNARQLARIDTKGAELTARLEALIIEAGDLAAEFGDLAGSCEFDEAQTESINTRMDAWLELKRKHGPDVAQVLKKREALARKLATQGDIEGTISKLEESAGKLKRELLVLAEQLRKIRTAAAKELSGKAEGALGKLGFKKGKLLIEILPENDLTEHGDSACRFLFTPNAGQPPLPLSKIASSGEAARVMLALKAVLAQVDETPVLVFDEVDANVGGEIAKAVGLELATLGKRHQVFCVTHQPQVAALAGQHFVVEKQQTDSSTTILIQTVHDAAEKRVGELARMLGDRHSTTARKHAAELLAGQ